MFFYDFILHLMYPNYPIFCSHVSADQLTNVQCKLQAFTLKRSEIESDRTDVKNDLFLMHKGVLKCHLCKYY